MSPAEASREGLTVPYYQDEAVTIYHGDAMGVLPQLAAESVDAIVADPPYKISQQYSASTDSDNVLAVASIWPVAAGAFRVARPGALAVVFYDTRILPLALQAMRGAGWKYLRALTLYRRWGAASKLHGWMSTSDFLLIFAKPGARYHFYADRTAHDVYIKDKPEAESSGHPAQKPLACMAHVVENVTPPDGIVLDPFLGSGTTAVAASRSGRRMIGIEIEERYCEMAADAAQRCANRDGLAHVCSGTLL